MLGNQFPNTVTGKFSLWSVRLTPDLRDHQLGQAGLLSWQSLKGLSQCHNVFVTAMTALCSLHNTLMQASDRGIENRIGIIEIQCGADLYFGCLNFIRTIHFSMTTYN